MFATLLVYSPERDGGEEVEIDLEQIQSIDDLNEMLEGSLLPEADEIELIDVSGFYDDSEVAARFEGVGFEIGELAEFAEQVEELGEGFELRYLDLCGDFTPAQFHDQYSGCWNSFQEFAEEMFDSCYSIPDNIAGYIDYEAFARDLRFDYSEYDGSEGTHVFSDY